MLVLTRRVGQQIVIADNIRVAICDIQGRKVRLGITAPSTVTILRQELAVKTAGSAPVEDSMVASNKGHHGHAGPRNSDGR